MSIYSGNFIAKEHSFFGAKNTRFVSIRFQLPCFASNIDQTNKEPTFSKVSLKSNQFQQSYGQISEIRKNCHGNRALIYLSSHGKLKLANSCWKTSKRWQTRTFTRQTRRLLTPVSPLALQFFCLFFVSLYAADETSHRSGQF